MFITQYNYKNKLVALKQVKTILDFKDEQNILQEYEWKQPEYYNTKKTELMKSQIKKSNINKNKLKLLPNYGLKNFEICKGEKIYYAKIIKFDQTGIPKINKGKYGYRLINPDDRIDILIENLYKKGKNIRKLKSTAKRFENFSIDNSKNIGNCDNMEDSYTQILNNEYFKAFDYDICLKNHENYNQNFSPKNNEKIKAFELATTQKKPIYHNQPKPKKMPKTVNLEDIYERIKGIKNTLPKTSCPKRKVEFLLQYSLDNFFDPSDFELLSETTGISASGEISNVIMQNLFLDELEDDPYIFPKNKYHQKNLITQYFNFE